jgi:FkbM family methyltransferase
MRKNREMRRLNKNIRRSIERIEKKLSMTDDTVYVGSVKFYIPNFPLDLIQRVLAYGHFWEEDSLKRLDKYLTRESVVFDIGANIGNHTIYWSKITDGVGVKRVYAFEPIDLTFSVLEKNVRINELGSVRVIINKVGLGREEGFAEVGDTQYDYSNIGKTSIRTSSSGPFKIISLDSYVNSANFRDKRIDFIKIDVENFEVELLFGAIETIKKYSPIIFIESFPNNFEKVDNLLKSLGYRMKEEFGGDNFLYIRQEEFK